jgi:hypothetical protein
VSVADDNLAINPGYASTGKAWTRAVGKCSGEKMGGTLMVCTKESLRSNALALFKSSYTAIGRRLVDALESGNAGPGGIELAQR